LPIDPEYEANPTFNGAYSVPMVQQTPQTVQYQAQQPDIEQPKKSGNERIAEYSQKLQKPTESIAFLEYFSKHLAKVEFMEKNVRYASYALMVPAGLALTFAAFCYMESQKKIKLGASMNDAEMSQAMNGISMIIWGLVAAKAKHGFDAAGSKDSATVTGTLQRIGMLCVMIAAAAGFNVYGNYEAQQAQLQNAPPKL